MAKFFLDLHECGTTIEDEEGLELANLDGARLVALKAAREIMCGEVSHGRLCLSCCIAIRDETGQIVMSVPFKDAVTLAGL